MAVYIAKLDLKKFATVQESAGVISLIHLGRAVAIAHSLPVSGWYTVFPIPREKWVQASAKADKVLRISDDEAALLEDPQSALEYVPTGNPLEWIQKLMAGLK